MQGGTRVGVITSGAGGVGKRTAPDDVQRLLIEVEVGNHQGEGRRQAASRGGRGLAGLPVIIGQR